MPIQALYITLLIRLRPPCCQNVRLLRRLARARCRLRERVGGVSTKVSSKRAAVTASLLDVEPGLEGSTRGEIELVRERVVEGAGDALLVAVVGLLEGRGRASDDGRTGEEDGGAEVGLRFLSGRGGGSIGAGSRRWWADRRGCDRCLDRGGKCPIKASCR
jgi:hypothetical protein